MEENSYFRKLEKKNNYEKLLQNIVKINSITLSRENIYIRLSIQQ